LLGLAWEGYCPNILYHKFNKSPNGVFWLKERSGNNGAFSMVLGTILSATLMLFLSIKHQPSSFHVAQEIPRFTIPVTSVTFKSQRDARFNNRKCDPYTICASKLLAQQCLRSTMNDRLKKSWSPTLHLHRN
jgi:hypothetical protein